MYACACFSTNKTEICPTVLDYFPIFAIEILFLKHRISATDSLARWEWSKRPAHRRELLNSNDATRLLEHPRSSRLVRRAFGEPLAIGRVYGRIRLSLNVHISLIIANIAIWYRIFLFSLVRSTFSRRVGPHINITLYIQIFKM